MAQFVSSQPDIQIVFETHCLYAIRKTLRKLRRDHYRHV